MPTSYRPSRPIAVLEIQQALADWWASPIGTRFADGFITSTRKSSFQESMFPPSWRGDVLADMEVTHLRRAPTYVITEPMIALTDSAAKTMNPQPLKETDLPSSNGFLWFDRPYITTDVRAMHAAIKAIAWAPARFRRGEEGDAVKGIQVSFYSDPSDPSDEDAVVMKANDPALFALMPRLLFYHLDSWVFEETWEQEQLEYIPHTDSLFEEGVPSFEERRTRPVQLNDDLRRFLQAAWTIMQQPLIVATQIHSPDRPMRRRLERAHREVSVVNVIVLRRSLQRADSGEPTGETANYSHRFLVDGHWHTYHFKEGPRQLYILPYIKGPEDLPLVLKKSVYHWKR